MATLSEELSSRLIGQPEAIKTIIPAVHMFKSNLAPEGRPVGVFMLLGPTGTGKTKTVESLAEVLHGYDKTLLRIDCAEFQQEHEVCKLIGAPPGYLGHRETHPMITQTKMRSLMSDANPVTLVLFDEIEKAAPSLQRLLLGILDRATLHLGDASDVNFEDSIIFLTSNLGARGMQDQLQGFGFTGSTPKLENHAMSAVRKHFSPEFMNRVDACIHYQILTYESMKQILKIELGKLKCLIDTRLNCCYELQVGTAAQERILQQALDPKYGARELKRVLTRRILQPLAEKLSELGSASSGIIELDSSLDLKIVLNKVKRVGAATLKLD